MSLEHRVVQDDCMGPEGLPSLADRSVAHAVMDPPYSARVHDHLADERWHPLTFEHLNEEKAAAVARELCRVVRGWIVVFCDEITLGVWVRLIEAAGGAYVRPGHWVKTNPMPHCDLPSVAIESIVLARGPRGPGVGRLRWHRGGEPALYHAPAVETEVERVHPTQKPLLVMEAIVRDFTDPGDLVVDPFAGGGSTGVACKHLGRSFVGWEINQEYAEAARRRIEAAREQVEMPFPLGRFPKSSRSAGPRPPNSTLPGYPPLFAEEDEP